MGLEPTHLSIPEPKSGAATNYAKGAKLWCSRPESNRHDLRRQILSLLWLPITPLEHSFQLYEKALGCLTTTSLRLTTLSSSDWSSNTLQANLVRRDYTVSALARAKVLFPSFMQLGRVCAATDLSLTELPTGVGNPMRLHIVARHCDLGKLHEANF